MAWRWTGAATSSSPTTGNNAVKEILAAGGYTTVNTLAADSCMPSGVAVDASGNVFVADYGNNAVKGDSGGGRLHHGQHPGQRIPPIPMAWRWTGAATSSSPIRHQQCGGEAGLRRSAER